MKYLITVLALIGLLMPAAAQDTDFKVRYETFIKGGIKIIGNDVINRKEKGTSPNDPYNDRSPKAKLNDEFDMQHIDVDNDPNTFASNAARFSYDGTGGEVAYVGLYWATTYLYNSGVLRGTKNIPVDKNREEASSMLFKTPDINACMPISDELIYDGINGRKLKNATPYAYYANVTSLLVPATKVVGDYTVANVRAALGQIEGGSATGWALVIVYENPDNNVKKIITYDGFSVITNEESKTFSFKGFKIPEEGDFKARIMGVTLEDDLNMMGDSVSITVPENGKTTSLESKVRPAQNLFNSSINVNDDLVMQRGPASLDTLGFDLFRVDIKDESRYLTPNNTTSFGLNYTRSRDRYFLFLTVLEIENNPEEITQLYRSIRVTELTAKDTERGYYIIVGALLNISNVNKRVEEMKNFGYDAKVYYNRDQVLNFTYVDRFDKYEDTMKRVEETRENTKMPDPWILDVANYEQKQIKC